MKDLIATDAKISHDQIVFLINMASLGSPQETLPVRQDCLLAMAREVLLSRRAFARIPGQFGIASSDIEDFLAHISKEPATP
jgi:hypothetical protein